MRYRKQGELVYVADVKVLKKNIAQWMPSQVFAVTDHRRVAEGKYIVCLNSYSVGVDAKYVKSATKKQVVQYKNDLKTGHVVRGTDLALLNRDNRVMKLHPNAKNAPYLKIDGKPVKIGQEYWTVYKHDYRDCPPHHRLRFQRHNAGMENNVTYCEYFTEREKAVDYLVLHVKVLSIHDINKSSSKELGVHMDKLVRSAIAEYISHD